jgi:hypothetical protein
MALKVCTLSIVVGILVVACASGPRVLALPGTGKTLEQFHTDDSACREWAARTSMGQRDYDMAYLQCMYGKGNRIPVTGGAQPAYVSPPGGAVSPNVPPPPPGTPPAPPPGTSK